MKPRNYAIDVLRICASLMVVAIHADVVTASPTNYVGGISWWIVAYIHSVSRAAVPLFVMISGLLNIQPSRTSIPRPLSWKMLDRLFVPLAVWTIISFYWSISKKGEQYAPIEIVSLLLSGNFFHMYFLVVLLGLYVITPYLNSRLPLNSQKKEFILMIALTLLALTQEIVWYLTGVPFFNTVITLWVPYLGFYLAGYVLPKLTIPLNSRACVGIILLLTFLNTVFRYTAVTDVSNWSNFFTSHFNPFIMINAGLIFLLFMRKISPIINHVFLRRMITYLAPLTYGIYLIHPFILDLLDHYARMAVHLITGNLCIYYMKKVILTYIISGVLVFGILRIPFIKRIVGQK